MIVKERELLAPYTTFRIGGVTPHLYIPESEQELIDLLTRLAEEKRTFRILGNGSNVLIRDGELDFDVVLLTKACMQIQIEGVVVTVGASYDLRKFIPVLAEHNLQAPAGLMTVPATVGGALWMNAARMSLKTAISDHLEKVRFFDGEKIREISKEECALAYRETIFQAHPEWVILSATFRFPHQPKAEALKHISDSLKAASDKSYRKHPSAGSVFKQRSWKIMQLVRGLRIGDAEWSKTTQNTIHNRGHATFRDVLWLIRIVQLLHRLTFQRCTLEVIVWK